MYISSVEYGKAKRAFFYFHTFGGPFHHSDLVTSARAFQLGSRIKLLPYTNFYLEVYATK